MLVISSLPQLLIERNQLVKSKTMTTRYLQPAGVAKCTYMYIQTIIHACIRRHIYIVHMYIYRGVLPLQTCLLRLEQRTVLHKSMFECV